MARKLPVLQRVLGAPTLFSVAYGEIASSIYFALGIIAGHALGLTPEVLLLTGLLFLVVALSYAEGIAAMPETGGAATLVRKAFNDFAGFCTGWVLFLDYIIVIALSALFLPHYLGGALEIDALQRHPWDVVVGVAAILAIAARPPVPAARSVHGRDRRGGARPRHAAARRRARPCPALLARRADAGRRARFGPELVRARVRPAARDARVHGPRDGGQPRRGGAAAGSRHSAQSVRRDRRRRRPLHRDRRRRALGLSRVRRRDRARRANGSSRRCSASSTCSARISRRCSPTRCASSWASPARSSSSPPRRRPCPGSGASPTRWASTGCCRARSGVLGRRTLISPAALASVVVIAAGGLIAVTRRGRRRGRVPRGAVQLRRPPRVRSRAARRDPPSLHCARAGAPVPRARERPLRRRRRPDPGRRRARPDARRLGHRR